MNNFRDGWYLIYTKPRFEKKVHARLAEKSISTFLPTRKVIRTWHDRKKFVDEPLFPSYVFVHLTNLQSYYEGMDTEGALNYVRTGNQIARVSESIVNDIKMVVGQSQDSIEVSDLVFLPGERMVISKGALTGLCCEVVEHGKANKLLVRVELLRRNLLISLPESDLLPA